MSLYKDTERVLVSKADILVRVKQIAVSLSEEYRGKNPLFIGILKGSVLFFSDIVRELDFPIEMDFMAISSYGASTRTSGEVKVVMDTDKSLAGRHVLLIEDIIDTGLTLSYMKNLLESRGPASLKICTLLDKPERRVADVKPDYIGFSIPNNFVVGYGLDYAQAYRNIPEICVLKPEVYTQ
jgi:hypoxanthine phosphoribosyltransferase